MAIQNKKIRKRISKNWICDWIDNFYCGFTNIYTTNELWIAISCLKDSVCSCFSMHHGQSDYMRMAVYNCLSRVSKASVQISQPASPLPLEGQRTLSLLSIPRSLRKQSNGYTSCCGCQENVIHIHGKTKKKHHMLHWRHIFLLRSCQGQIRTKASQTTLVSPVADQLHIKMWIYCSIKNPYA